jgi:hypothetical protein
MVMQRKLCVATIAFSLAVLMSGIGWVAWNIATAGSMTWFATPLSSVLWGAAIIDVWLSMALLPVWWVAHRHIPTGE